jgi:uncharacterized protein DUF1161
MIRQSILALILPLLVVPALAQKPCEELKSEIATKLEAKGVKSFSLSIVEPKDVGEQKVVGSCEGGTKRITYVNKAKLAQAGPIRHPPLPKPPPPDHGGKPPRNPHPGPAPFPKPPPPDHGGKPPTKPPTPKP